MAIDLQTRLQQIAAKSGKPLAEVKNTYNTALASLPPNITGDQARTKYALKIANRDLTGGSKSNAIAFEGVIFGAEEARDMMVGVRKKAIEEYQRDPSGFVNSGQGRMEGTTLILLDNRATFADGKANPFFGKEKPNNFFIRRLKAAIRKPGESTYTPGTIQLRGDQANIPVILGKLVGFRALGDIVNGEFELRSSTVTQFETKQELPAEEQIRILDSTFSNHYKELGECLSYHKSLEGKPDFYERYVITEGAVRYIKFAATPDKSHMVILGDDSLPDDKGVQVWVPNKLRSLINFGRDSIITVIGRTRVGPGWDSKNRVPLPEVEQVSLEAFSLFGRPGLTTIVEEQGPELI